MKTNQNFTILGSVQTTGEFFAWFNLLAEGNTEKENEIAIIYDETGNVFRTIVQYRRKLMQNNPIPELNMENTEIFREQLEQMFLEPVSSGYVKTIIKVMKENKWTAEDVIKAHQENKENRIWRIISCKNRYIAC